MQPITDWTGQTAAEPSSNIMNLYTPTPDSLLVIFFAFFLWNERGMIWYDMKSEKESRNWANGSSPGLGRLSPVSQCGEVGAFCCWALDRWTFHLWLSLRCSSAVFLSLTMLAGRFFFDFFDFFDFFFDFFFRFFF